MLHYYARPVCTLVVMCLLCGCSGQQEKPAATNPPQADIKPAGPNFGTFAVEPNAGTGGQQVFRLNLSRESGSPVPALVGLLINDGARGTDACYVFAETAGGGLLLVNDSGAGSKALGKSPSVANSQCELLKEESGVQTSAVAVNAVFNIRFRPGFKGPKKLFAIAQDATGATPGLQPVGGQWTVQ